jgi:hypothetical protein
LVGVAPCVELRRENSVFQKGDTVEVIKEIDNAVIFGEGFITDPTDGYNYPVGTKGTVIFENNYGSILVQFINKAWMIKSDYFKKV